jgi:hypothetical protein
MNRFFFFILLLCITLPTRAGWFSATPSPDDSVDNSDITENQYIRLAPIRVQERLNTWWATVRTYRGNQVGFYSDPKDPCFQYWYVTHRGGDFWQLSLGVLYSIGEKDRSGKPRSEFDDGDVKAWISSLQPPPGYDAWLADKTAYWKTYESVAMKHFEEQATAPPKVSAESLAGGKIANQITGVIVFVLLAVAVVLLYFLPSAIGILRRAPQLLAVIMLNLFFGWTVLGWGPVPLFLPAGRKKKEGAGVL